MCSEIGRFYPPMLCVYERILDPNHTRRRGFVAVADRQVSNAALEMTNLK